MNNLYRVSNARRAAAFITAGAFALTMYVSGPALLPEKVELFKQEQVCEVIKPDNKKYKVLSRSNLPRGKYTRHA